MNAYPSRACPVTAVLIAPLAAMLPLVAWALYVVFFSDVLLLPDGSPDDVPFRAVGVLMFLSPLLYLMLACFYALLFYVLARLRRLTWRALLLSSALIPGGLIFALMLIPSRAAEADTAGVALGLGVAVGVCAALGALAQWLIAELPLKKQGMRPAKFKAD